MLQITRYIIIIMKLFKIPIIKNIFKNVLDHFFQKIYQSIKINYKTWISFIISCYILADFQLLFSFVCFYWVYTYTYVGHLISHDELYRYAILSISHIAHHAPFSGRLEFIMNLIMEFLSVTYPIIVYYIIKEFEITSIFFLDEWIILFMYFFYTVLHNVNYGPFKPNIYHSKHHENTHTNYTPDFFDLLCETKNDDTPELENTDFYLPTILFSFIITFILKYKYKSFSNIIPVFNSIWIICYIIISIFAVYSIIKQVKQSICNEESFFI